MFNLIITLSWLWGHILAKFIIWPRRLQGILWLPILNASNWYRMTEIKGKILYIYLPHLYVYENTICLFSFIFLPIDNFIMATILFSHVINNIWWPAFIEIKYSFQTCFILSIVNIISCMSTILWTIYLYGYPIFIIFCIAFLLASLWHLWISSYTLFVVKKPTTFIEYQERQARQTMNV